MIIWIETNKFGTDVLRNNSAELGCERRPKALPADHILIRASDGHVFAAPPGVPLARLSAAQTEMVKYFLAERGMPEISVFMGEPQREAKPDG